MIYSTISMSLYTEATIYNTRFTKYTNVKMENFMANNITDDTFEEEVLKSNIPVLVDFWAEWCGPCKMLTPIIEELAKEFQDKVKIVKLNIDQNPNTPSTVGIRSIPTMTIYKNGKLVDTKIGALPKNSIVEWINSSI